MSIVRMLRTAATDHHTADRWQNRHGYQHCLLLAVYLLSVPGLQAADDNATTANHTDSMFSAAARNLSLVWPADSKLNLTLLEQSMNKSQDPCEDFYQYACGNYGQTHRPQGGLAPQNVVNERLKGLLESPYDPSTEAQYVRNAKNFYQSCVDEDQLRKLGPGPLQELVKKMGPWPLMSNGSPSEGSQDLETTLVNLAYMGMKPFFELKVGTDVHNNSIPVVWFYAGILSISKEHLLQGRNTTELLRLQQSSVDLAVHALGVDPSPALNQSISDVLDFEIQLAELYRKAKDSSSPQEDKQLLLNDTNSFFFKGFNVTKFLMTFFERANVTLLQDRDVYVVHTSIFNLTQLIEQTDKRVVYNYLLIRLARSLYQTLPEEIRDLDQPLRKALYGRSGDHPRWVTCVKMTSQYLHEAAGSLYVSHYFPPPHKEKAAKIVEFIREGMKEVIMSASWLDRSTKAKALEKADKIVANVGYPDYFLNGTIMKELNENVEFDPKAFFQNVLKAAHRQVVNNAKGIHQSPPSKDKWTIPPTDVNAYYEKQSNVMALPAAILQLPFFGDNLDDSQLFGSLGMMVGHEMTHAFDETGRYYDEHGNMAPWWSNASIARFDQLASCFVDQYSQHVSAGVPIDGKKTLDENIADNGGVKVAIKAFKKWQSLHENRPELPGSNFTRDQILFISMTQIFCTVQTKAHAKTKALIDIHSPGNVRANMMMSNSEEFAHAFNCPVGTKMNPKVKCKLW